MRSFNFECFSVESKNPRLEVLTVPAADRCGKASSFASVLGYSAISALAKKYKFSASSVFVIPRPEDMACAPPDGYITVYEDCLDNGLRFPLNLVYRELIPGVGIVVGEVMSNSYKHFSGLGVAVGHLGHAFTSDVVRRCFQVKPSPNLVGWFYLSARVGFELPTTSKNQDWELKYFFYKSEDDFL